MKNNIKLTISLFILSLITLTSTVFAWVSLSKRSNIDGMGGNISDFTDIVIFEVKRKDDEGFTLIESIDDMHSVFGATKPSETYTFRILIENKSAREFEVFSSINGVKTLYYNNMVDYDLRDVFYIEQGLVNFKLNNDSIYSETLTPNGNNIRNKHEQVINEFSLSNLIDVNNNISLFSPKALRPSDEISITFTLVYDENTKNINYQENQLNFEGIFLFGQ